MTQREFEQAMMMRRPQLDDLAVNEYGDRAYGTPEATIWNDAFERARARIENPRWEGLGTVPGGLDSPENVSREVFEPVLGAFEPQLAITRDVANNRSVMDLERQNILREQQARLSQQLLFEREQEKRKAADMARKLALDEKTALNNFNLRSRAQMTPRSKAQDFAIKGRIELARKKVLRAQELNDAEAETAAMAELDALEQQLPGMSDAPTPSFASEMPSFEFQPSPMTATAPAPVLAEPTVVAPSVKAPAMDRAQIDALRAEAMKALLKKDRAAVAKRFRELTGEDL